MAVYRVQILPNATRDLERLSKPVAHRIVERINWLAGNLDAIRPEAYKGALAGLYKFRVGDYRVIYQILHDEHIIVIYQVGHRSDIYRKR